MSTLNINAFSQVAVRGQQDLSILRSGIISGMVSAANTTTPIGAGDAVAVHPARGASGAGNRGGRDPRAVRLSRGVD